MAPTYKKIAPATLTAWKIQLSGWAKPVAFQDQVETMKQHVKGAFFKQPGMGFLRDAWVAGKVAIILSADQQKAKQAVRGENQSCCLSQSQQLWRLHKRGITYFGGDYSPREGCVSRSFCLLGGYSFSVLEERSIFFFKTARSNSGGLKRFAHNVVFVINPLKRMSVHGATARPVFG
jgi:hypothetical protein